MKDQRTSIDNNHDDDKEYNFCAQDCDHKTKRLLCLWLYHLWKKKDNAEFTIMIGILNYDWEFIDQLQIELSPIFNVSKAYN